MTRCWTSGITVFVFLGFAVPTFWLALLLMYVFGVKLGWLPISGLHSLGSEAGGRISWLLDMAKHLVLPVFVATFSSLAGLSRYMRSTMLEVISQDYITTARAKGLTERAVIYRHALRNALLPVITLLGFSVPGLIGGSVIFETIYAIPGHGPVVLHGGDGSGLSAGDGNTGHRCMSHPGRKSPGRYRLCSGGSPDSPRARVKAA